MSEILTRLNAGAQWGPDKMPGGINQLPPSIIAGALAGLGDGPYRLLWCKYVDPDDKNSLTRLITTAYLAAMDIVKREGWEIPKGQEVYRELSRTAIIASLAPSNCPKCKGRGHVYPKYPKTSIVRPCHHCIGTGHKSADADVSHISRRKKDRYRYRWRVINAEYLRWEEIGVRHVRRELMGDE